MKKLMGTLKVTLGLAVIAAFLLPLIHCGGVGNAQVAQTPASQDPIVGFWYFQFVAEGNTADSSGLPADHVPPDGAVLDSGYWQWNAGGTEIINSMRLPSTQSFCLGMWQNAGSSQYKVNHFAISWNSDGSYLGPANIRPQVTLSNDLNSLTGTFTLDQDNSGGSALVHLMGKVTAQRIALDTTVQRRLPVPPPAP